MKTKFRNFIAIIFIAISLTACKDKEDDPPAPVIGEAKLKINFTQPDLKYSTQRDNNAKPDEEKINTVLVLIYNDAGTIEKQQELTESDFVLNNDIYEGKSSIVTTTGVKTIYVGINIPAAIKSRIIASGPATAVKIALIDEITSAGNGAFAMFSGAINKTLIEGENTVAAIVQRLVAKVALQKSSALQIDPSIFPGTISFDFAIRNTNSVFFPLEKKVASVVEDPNYNAETAGTIKGRDLLQGGDYVAINETGVVNKDLTAKYTNENTSAEQYRDELTFVSVRGSFIPSQIIKYTNGVDASGGFNTEANVAPLGTFFRIKKSDGTTVFAINPSVANDYVAANPDSESIEYQDGYTYFSAYLNPENTYDVFRNDFYKLNITAINSFGNNTPDDGGHIQLETPTDITITIEILDWNLIDNDTQLP